MFSIILIIPMLIEALVLPSQQQCTHGDIRLVGDCLPYQGRVEVCVNSTWGTVCDDFWDEEDAIVVCGQLGYPQNGSQAFRNAYFGQGTGPIVLDSVECNPAVHERLLDCPTAQRNNYYYCYHFEDAGVACMPFQQQCSHGDVRLVGDCLPNQGRVEVCVNSTWGTVCDDDWGDEDAMVVCGQLGYIQDGSQAFRYAHFGPGTGPIVLDEVGCNSAVHRRLLECPSLIGPLQHNCHHFEDAGVACSEFERVEGNVSVSPVREPSTMYTAEVSLTWEQRSNSQEQNRHSSFRVECTSRRHSVTVSVQRKQSFTTPIGGLLPSTSYNCCVSALYENGYTGEGTCTHIETTHTPTSATVESARAMESTQPQVIGGVLGFIIILLLILLVLMGIALGCVLRTRSRETGLSFLVDKRSSTIPVRNNASYSTQPPPAVHLSAVSRAPPQVRGSTAQSVCDVVPSYSSVGPAYEALESNRRQLEEGANRVNMRERYEFAEIHAETNDLSGAQESQNYEVPVPSNLSGSGGDEYSHLQH